MTISSITVYNRHTHVLPGYQGSPLCTGQAKGSLCISTSGRGGCWVAGERLLIGEFAFSRPDCQGNESDKTGDMESRPIEGTMVEAFRVVGVRTSLEVAEDFRDEDLVAIFSVELARIGEATKVGD